MVHPAVVRQEARERVTRETEEIVSPGCARLRERETRERDRGRDERERRERQRAFRGGFG